MDALYLLDTNKIEKDHIHCNRKNRFFSITHKHDKSILSFLGLKFTFAKKAKSKRAIEEENKKFQFFSINNKLLHFAEENKLKNKFILFYYYYLSVPDIDTTNLGDYVQTFATQNALKTNYTDAEFIFNDRDSLSDYCKEQALCVMQGWFSHQCLFMPNSNILPVFVGTHITPQSQKHLKRFLSYNPSYFHNREIGCRDKQTCNFFHSIGVKSYFSRCLTLTFPKREASSQQNEIFIVNISKEYLKYIPDELVKNAKFVNQRAVKTENNPDNLDSSCEMYYKLTQDLLQMYKNNAKLVITSAIHCAMPCLAMGIPVILIDFEKNNSRFDVLDGILHIYSKEDLINKKIDFNPLPVDIEDLKKDILQNLYLSIEKTRGRPVDENKLNKIRKRIADFNIL